MDESGTNTRTSNPGPSGRKAAVSACYQAYPGADRVTSPHTISAMILALRHDTVYSSLIAINLSVDVTKDALHRLHARPLGQIVSRVLR
jgi:hypothetical protein